MKGYVYILRNSDGRYYVGSTGDFAKRLKQHVSGATKTTKSLKTFTPVLVQEYNTLLEARSIERKLKKMKRKDYLEKMVRDGYIKILLP